MAIYFTSDHHFEHANILKFCNRPFKNVEEMNVEFIRSWNNVVGVNDVVYHLGDFCFGGVAMAQKFLSQLRGEVHVLCNPWHHDRRWISKATLAVYEQPLMVLTLEDYRIHNRPVKLTLCHYPLEEWEASHYGAWHVHGHSHGKKDTQRNRPVLDVGVDSAYRILGCWRPFALSEVAEICIQRSQSLLAQ